MTAAEALKAARAIGIEVVVDGDDLVLQASVAPLPSILDTLSHHKAAILALLRPADGGWTGEDWHDFFEERAAIGEFDGGLTRVQAEAQAFRCCVVEWLNRTHVGSSPEYCLLCNGADLPHNRLLPHGIEPSGHAWLHDHCWPAWHAGRTADAIAALESMGLAQPASLPEDFGKIRGA